MVAAGGKAGTGCVQKGLAERRPAGSRMLAVMLLAG